MSPLRRLGIVAGLPVLAVWVPVLAAGLWSLRSRSRLGRSGTLITAGVYRYVRHPLYAGFSLSAVGLGLVLGSRALTVGGAAWLFVTQAWAVGEERQLSRRFGPAYERYRASTPRLIPDVARFLAEGARWEPSSLSVHAETS